MGALHIKSSDESEIIPVLCSNGYTMLTPALNLRKYLYFLKSLKLDSNTEFGVAHECGSCLSSNDVAIDEDNLWIASIHLDQSQCPCYKPVSTTTYYV